jgi:hypothetical protein
MTWLKRRLDIDPGQHMWEIPGVLWWRVKQALLWDDLGPAERRSIDSHGARWRWCKWMFLHWLQTGRWDREPLTEEQRRDRIFQRGFRIWLLHILTHRKADYWCEYCGDKFPVGS